MSNNDTASNEFNFATATPEEALTYALKQLARAQKNAEARGITRRKSKPALFSIDSNTRPSYLSPHSSFDERDKTLRLWTRNVAIHGKLDIL